MGILNAFGSKENLKKHVKVFLIGNEIDANGPNSSEGDFSNYYTLWIPEAFDNLQKSLTDAMLPDIPVSTIIANYPLQDPSTNVVSSSITNYVKEHWSQQWNSGSPFVFFNQYTQDNGKSADYGPVILYFESVDSTLSGTPNVYVGETGFSAEYTVESEAKVINQIFKWLESQYAVNKLTIPLFVFQAFDRPAKPVGQKKMGIFKDNSGNMPLGLKKDIHVPKWIRKPKVFGI